MITFFARGVMSDGRRIVYLARAHDYVIHRGQRFFIEYQGENIAVTHAPSGRAINSKNFCFKSNDTPEEVKRKICNGLDKNWDKLLEKVKRAERCSWR